MTGAHLVLKPCDVVFTEASLLQITKVVFSRSRKSSSRLFHGRLQPPISAKDPSSDSRPPRGFFMKFASNHDTYLHVKNLAILSGTSCHDNTNLQGLNWNQGKDFIKDHMHIPSRTLPQAGTRKMVSGTSHNGVRNLLKDSWQTVL